MNARLLKLRTLLKIKKLDAVLVSSIPNIIYLTGFTGFSKDEREAFLLITKTKQYIITDGRYSEAVLEKITHFNLLEVSSQNSIKNLLGKIIQKHKIKKLAIEEKNLTLYENKTLFDHYNNIHHCSDIINSLRAVKGSNEIKLIENACRLGDKTFDYLLKEIKLGVSEKELALKIEFFIRKMGGDISFPPIVAFGSNSSVPHHVSGNQKLKKRSIVLLDFGVRINNYCSDMTRTVFFGSSTDELKRMYSTVLEAQNLAIQQFNNLTMEQLGRGIKAYKIDETARDYIISKGYPTIPHSLGHGIGVEVHELPRLSPRSTDIIKPGMVFSIEPGIYVPGFGGIRIEDLVVIQNDKLKIITHSPKTFIEL